MKQLSLLLLLFFIGYSCGSGERQTPDQQAEGVKWDAVMANHDIVMPLMDKTHSLRKQLKAYVKEQGTAEGMGMKEAQNIISQLNQADEGMMDWMHGFKKLGELQGTMSHQEILQYLEAEDKKMVRVKKLFDTSLKQGADFLAKNNQ